MSRNHVTIEGPDGEVLGYALDNSTVDVLQPWVLPTIREAWNVWYPNDGEYDAAGVGAWWDKARACVDAKHPLQPAIAVCQTGTWWAGAWCPACCIWQGPKSPWEDNR